MIIDNDTLPEVIYDADKQEIYIESTDPEWPGRRQTRWLLGMTDFTQEIAMTRMMAMDTLAIIHWLESEGAKLIAQQNKLNERREAAARRLAPHAGTPFKYADLDFDLRTFVDDYVKLETELEELREFRSRVPEVIA